MGDLGVDIIGRLDGFNSGAASVLEEAVGGIEETGQT